MMTIDRVTIGTRIFVFGVAATVTAITADMVTFDMDNGHENIADVAEVTLIADVAVPTHPDFAKLIGYVTANPRSRNGIRPVGLFHFNIGRQGPFIVTEDSDTLYMPCTRCRGYGEYSYNALDGSVCYGCYGAGTGKVTTWVDAAKTAKRRQADSDRRDRAEWSARWDEAHAWDTFRSGHADVIAFLSGKDERSGFVGDMARKVAALIPLSERMVDAVRRTSADQTARTAVKVAAGHVGTVGKREVFEVRVLAVRPIETDYGVSYLVIMETRDGAALKTFGSGTWAHTVTADADTFISVKATVKAHDEYQGVPQTMLTRVASA